MPRLEPPKRKPIIKAGKWTLPAVGIGLLLLFVGIWFALPKLISPNNKSTNKVATTEASDPAAAAAIVAAANKNDLDTAKTKLAAILAIKNPNPQEVSAAYIEVGNAYSNNGQEDQAIAAQQQALKYSPNNISAITALALAYKDGKEYQKAIDQYNLAISIYKTSTDPNVQGSIERWQAMVTELQGLK